MGSCYMGLGWVQAGLAGVSWHRVDCHPLHINKMQKNITVFILFCLKGWEVFPPFFLSRFCSLIAQ